MKLKKKISILFVLCGIGFTVTGITLRYHNSKNILENLQQQILDATNNVPSFDKSIHNIVQEGAQKLHGDNEQFKKLIFTMDDDRWTIIAHLAIEYNYHALEETINIIQEFFGENYKPISQLMRRRDDVGRSPLYFVVLRKRNDMLKILLKKAQEIFGHDKKEFLLFINGEDRKGHREKLNYRTPLILAAYNDDALAVSLLINTARDVFGKDTKEFKEFIHARDANGATSGFYAGDETKGIILG